MSESAAESRCGYGSYQSFNYSSESAESRGGNCGSSGKKTQSKNISTDIGRIREKVIDELYEEFYSDIKAEIKTSLEEEKPQILQEVKNEVRQALQQQKTQIVQEATAELKSKLIDGFVNGKSSRGGREC